MAPDDFKESKNFFLGLSSAFAVGIIILCCQFALESYNYTWGAYLGILGLLFICFLFCLWQYDKFKMALFTIKRLVNKK